MVRVIIFDSDRTLVPTDLEKILFNYVIPTYIAGRYGLPLSEARNKFYDELRKASSSCEALFFSLEVISELINMPYDEIIQILDGICSVVIKPDPSIISPLRFLKEKGLRIVVLTDTDTAIATYKIKYAGLSKYIDKVFSSTELFGKRKTGKIYLKLMGFLRDVGYASDPKEVLVVGDDIERDYKAPREAGMHSILISDESVPGVDAIRHLGELIDILQL